MTSTMRFDKWENSLGQPYGTVLQVVTGTTTTQVNSTSGSFVTTGLSASITPKFASSKILVTAQTTGLTPNNSTVGVWSLFRGTVADTNIGNGTSGMIWIYATAATELRGTVACSALDSPNTTSPQVYTLGFRSNGSGGTIQSQPAAAQATITLMEIAQ
jgi:hypothetical protein